jgi:hypothetical protein
MLADKSPTGLNTANAGHSNVHQNEIGSLEGKTSEHLLATTCSGYPLNTGQPGNGAANGFAG